MRTRFHKFLASAALLIGLILALGTWLARGPDLEVEFVREVPAHAPMAKIDGKLHSVQSWVDWAHGVRGAFVLGSPDGRITQGSVVHLDFKARGLRRGTSFIEMKAIQDRPGNQIVFELLRDSSGKIPRLFDHVDWTFQLESTPAPGLVRAVVRGHTCHWRSRLFARLLPRMMMNQVLIVDLFRLTEQIEPFHIEFTPE